MQFKIDLKIFLFLLLFYFTNQIGTYILILAFAVLHELGHLACGLLLGMKLNKMELKPYGVSISFKLNTKDYNSKIGKGNLLEIKKIVVALAGPITNLIIILIALQYNMNVFLGLKIIYSNLLLILFNLLPFYPLDGGRILESVLHIICGKRKAEVYTNRISLITLIIITFVASITIFYVQNVAIFLIIILLWMLHIKEDRVYRRRDKIYKLIEKTIEIKAN